MTFTSLDQFPTYRTRRSRRQFAGPTANSAAPSAGTWWALPIAVATVLVGGASVFSTLWNGHQSRLVEEHNARRARIERCLDPRLFDQLVDPNSKRRSLGLILLNDCHLEKEYVAEIARAIAIHDDSPEVRANAASTLETFSKEHEPNLREISRKGLADYALASELRRKHLVSALNDAEAFESVHTPEGNQQALTCYRKVLSHLSEHAKATLGRSALLEAERTAEHGFVDHAVSELSVAFRPYLQNE